MFMVLRLLSEYIETYFEVSLYRKGCLGTALQNYNIYSKIKFKLEFEEFLIVIRFNIENGVSKSFETEKCWFSF